MSTNPSGFTGTLVFYQVPPATGKTAFDTPNVAATVAKLNTAGGNGALQFQDGTYQIDSNVLVVRNCTNFLIAGAGATIVTQAPNRAGLANNTAGDLMIIADCTDFRVEDMTFNALRDTVAPLTPLSATAASGQPSVTVAAGQGVNYVQGQWLNVFGGIGSADQGLQDTGKIISSITPGGGSGGGDLITFTTNLANSYAVTGGSAASDGFGPYAWTSDYLTPYQTGFTSTVAGRTMNGEDQQNCLHMLNCQRFSVVNCITHNMWESGIKCGNGFAATLLTDGCSEGAITDGAVYHGYDQGVSLWVSKWISVTGCTTDAAGWAGVSLSGSDYCTVTGCKSVNSVYRVPLDQASGSGIAIEGGRGNTIRGNVIQNPYSDGVRVWTSPLGFGITPASPPTLSAFTAAGTAAGTSIAWSATAGLVVGGLYSIVDGVRTEAVSIQSIVDGTHLKFNETLTYNHAASVILFNRIPQDNIFDGNTIIGPQNATGMRMQTQVRALIENNVIQNWASLAGIQMAAANGGATNLPAGTTLGGQGSVVKGNDLMGNITGAPAIRCDTSDNYLIMGNKISGPGGAEAIRLAGVTDSAVIGNHINDNVLSPGQGIYLRVGTTSAVSCARVAVKDNVITRCRSEGILVIGGTNLATDSLTIEGNVVSSCGGGAGINLEGITNCLVANNVSNSNLADGILLQANGTQNSVNNRVIGNTCRDDGSGINVSTGAAMTQQNGIIEGTGGNINLFLGNEVDANAVAQLTTVGVGTVTHYNVVSGAITA